MPPGQLFVIITGSFIDIASNKAFGAPSNLEDKTNENSNDKNKNN